VPGGHLVQYLLEAGLASKLRLDCLEPSWRI